MKKKYLKHSSILLILLTTFIFLSINRHNKSGFFEYRSEIWADKGGYYVYLPALFKFNFNPDLFPHRIDSLTGSGFRLDYEREKVLTKYYYGVALLQSPFFLVADFYAESKNQTPRGFAPAHHQAINIAAIFYMVAGLVFLAFFLKKRYNIFTVYLTLLIFLSASHLFYYSIDETGMSHVYSFAVFSAFLYYCQRINYLNRSNLKIAFLFGILCGLIIIIRPVNILFLSSFFFLRLDSFKALLQRIKNILYIKNLIPIALGVAIMLTPQFIYYYYSYEKILYDTYVNEAFNFLDPKLLRVWFAAYNGLFPYTPLYLLLIILSFYTIKTNKWEGTYLIVIFFIFSYILSSWWAWHFGCSFGARNFVEYLTLYSIPLAKFLEKLNYQKAYLKLLAYLLFILLAIHNIKLTYAFDECYFGDTWQWDVYFNLLLK